MLSPTCLGCGEEIDISGLKESDRFECAHCTDLTLELMRQEGGLTLRQVHRVSCPSCSQMIVEVVPMAEMFIGELAA